MNLKHQEQEIEHLKGGGMRFRGNGKNTAAAAARERTAERREGGGWGKWGKGEFIEEKLMEIDWKMGENLGTK